MEGIRLVDHIEDLDNESKYVVHKAKDAAQFAYAPYSKFHVGASILFDDGDFVIGCNQENASYPLSMCAERIALYSAASQHPGKVIRKLAVVAHKKNYKDLASTPPCGGCRQVILEFEVRQKSPITCIFLTAKNQWMVCDSVKYLLPESF